MMGKMRNEKRKSGQIGGMEDGRREEVTDWQGIADGDQPDAFSTTLMVREIKK